MTLYEVAHVCKPGAPPALGDGSQPTQENLCVSGSASLMCTA